MRGEKTEAVKAEMKMSVEGKRRTKKNKERIVERNY